MRFIRQKGTYECAVAVLAMVAKLSYLSAKRCLAFPSNRRQGTPSWYLIRALNRTTGYCWYEKVEKKPISIQEYKPSNKTEILVIFNDEKYHYSLYHNGVMYDSEESRPVPLREARRLPEWTCWSIYSRIFIG